MAMGLFLCLSGSLPSVSAREPFNCPPRSSLYRSTIAIVLHLHHSLWLHLRGVDGGRYLIFCRTFWSRLRLHPLSDMFP